MSIARWILIGVCALLHVHSLSAEESAGPDWAAIASEVQARPGDVAYALPRLERLLQAPDPYRDTALRQLVSLARLGVIPKTHDRLFEALYDRRHNHVQHDRLFQGSLMRDALVELGGANLRTDLISWGLILKSGDAPAAADSFRPYAARLGDLHADRTASDFLGYFDRDKPMARALAQPLAAPVTVPDPATVVATYPPGNLVEAITEAAATGLPATDKLGSVINPWWLLRAGLPSLDAAMRAALTQRQAGHATTSSADDAVTLATWRRQPYAPQVQRALLDAAWRDLVAGRRILAEASYHDVLAVAVDGALATEARHGLWLCWAGDPLRQAELAAAVDALSGPLTWGGQKRSPDELRMVLLSGPVAAIGSGLAGLRQIAIAAPVATGWSPALFNDYWNPAEFAGLMAPGLGFQVVDGLLLAAAPRMLAAYDLNDPQRPLWTKVASGEWSPESLNSSDRNMASLGPYIPAVADGTIYTRWGPAAVEHDPRHPREALRNRANLRALRQMPNHVAAFDLKSGAMRWSTAGRIAQLEHLVPVTDPIVDGDRVYVFCKDVERQSYRFSLLCLDAADGSLRWAREIGHGGEFQGGDHRSSKDVAWNTAMYGAAPIVRDGIAYWATGGGFVSAIDLRDGLVLWRHDYAITTPDMEVRGSSPVIVDDLLVVLAKDLRGVVALDRRTGVPRWTNPLLPVAEVAGRLNHLVAFRQGDRMTGVDVRSGGVRWTWQASGRIRGEIQQRGNVLVLAMDDRLLSLDLVTGLPGSETPFPGGSPQASFTIVGDSLLTVSPVIEADGSKTQDGLLKRATPRLHAGDAWGLLISDDAIEGVDWTGTLRWSRHKPFDLLDAAVVGERAVILGSREISALDAAGRRIWQRDLASVVDWEIEGGVAVVAHNAPDDDRYSIIDLENGSELSSVKRDSSNHWHHHSRSVSAAVIGTEFHRVVHHVLRRDKRSYIEHVVVPLRGGEERRKTIAEWKGEQWWKAGARHGNHLCFMTSNGDVHHLDLASGTYRKLGALKQDDHVRRHGRVSITVDAGLCLVELPRNYRHSRQDKDIRQVYRLGRDEGSYERTVNESLRLIDGAVWSCGRSKLVRLDEAGKETQALAIPRTSQGHAFTPLEWRRYGPDLVVLLRRERLLEEVRGKWQDASRGPNDRDHLALDRYGPDGELRARLMLPHVLPTSWSLSSDSNDHWPHIGHFEWSNEALWDDQGLWLSARDGVHRIDLRDLPEQGHVGSNTQLLYRLDGRLRIDGRIEDWAGVSHVEQVHDRGRLLITHDRSHLLIAVIQNAGPPLPLSGEGRFGGAGSWLQLDLRGNRSPIGGASWQFDLGLDASGNTVLRRTAPPGILSSVRYDHATDTVVYELAVPIDPLRDPKERLADEIGLGATTYLEGKPLAEWRHVAVRLHQYTTAQEQAGLSLTAALPGLSESHLFLREILATHIGDWPEGRAFCHQLLAEHRDAPLAAAVLLHLDEVLNGREDGREPDAEVLSVAEAAKVAAEQIECYRRVLAKKREHHRNWHKIEWPGLTALDPEQAQSLLEEQVLALGRAPAAVDFLRALRRVRDLDAEGSVALIRWFLERFPDHPGAEQLLEDWWSIAVHDQAGGDHAKARELMDAGLDAMTSLPWRLSYDFRRSKMYRDHTYVNEWHVVGPFPSLGLMEYDYGVPLPPRLHKVTLKERYRLPDRTLAWQPLTTGSQRVPISHWLGNPLEPSIAYCVTWVKSPDQRQVALELDADGPCRIWVNRHYVHRRESNEGQGPVHIWLAAGWNAILVEQAMALDGGWTFQLEVVERTGKGVLRDVEFLAANGHKAVADPIAVDSAKLRRGLNCEVFRGEWDQLPDFDQLTPEERKVSEHLDLSVTELRDLFGLRFTGLIKIDKLDFYTFSTISDDGSQLFIGDQMVVDNDGLHGTQERFGTVTLKPGYYPITVTMFEKQGGEHLEVFWRSHGGEKVKLEGQALWHRP